MIILTFHRKWSDSHRQETVVYATHLDMQTALRKFREHVEAHNARLKQHLEEFSGGMWRYRLIAVAYTDAADADDLKFFGVEMIE